MRLKLMALFEKTDVIDSVDNWQVACTVRNLAAHYYEIEYSEVTQHFSSLHLLKPDLYKTAGRFVQYA